MALEAPETFKVCPCCGEAWRCRDDFIKDITLNFNGYMADFDTLEKGLFYFTHHVEGCRSTLVVPAGRFLNLYTGKRHSLNNRDQDDCPGHCNDKGRLDRCDAICEYAFVREVIQIILKMKKQPADAFDPDMVILPWQDDDLL